jgi:hypothetical protein
MQAATHMKRLSASIPDRLFLQLERLASLEGRSVSNLVSYLLERSIDDRLELIKRGFDDVKGGDR